LIYSNATILTLDDDRRIISDGALRVLGRDIDAVGKTAELSIAFPEDDVIDCRGGIMLPGLIDTHVHTSQCLLRGVSEASGPGDFHTWLFGRIFPLQGAYTHQDALASASLCVLEMLKSGTTGFVECLLADHYGLDAIAQMCLDSGIRAALGNLVMDVSPEARDDAGWPPSMWQDRQSGIAGTIDGHQRWTDPHGRLQIWFGSRSVEPINNISLFPEVASLAREHGIGITIHLAELPFDNEYARSLGHRSHIALADHLGLLGPRTVLAHCTIADDDDIALLSATGTTVAHCPANNSATGWGPARVTEMLDAGVNVALGCDGAPTNANMDLLRDLRVTAHVARMRQHSRAAISPETILEMATRNGAKALGLDSRIGSLEPGKAADFIVIDTDSPHLQPMWNPVAAVVFAAQGSDVDTVVIDGTLVMHHREMQTMDEAALVANARRSQADVARRCGINDLGSAWQVI